MNPFQDRYDRCNTGSAQEKYEDLPAFPRIIDVELTSSCNFRCLMCPTGNLSLKRPPVFMKGRVWMAILEECAGYGTALRFIGWGEPTLHPSLPHIIRQATSYGLLTHVNTNGSKITPRFAEELVNAGLSSIKFSFQGVDRKSYDEMRNIDYFEDMIEAINAMRRARAGYMRPYIAASTSVTYETPEQIQRFRKRLGPMVDHLGVGTTTFDYMDLSAVRLKPDQIALLTRLKELSTDAKVHPDPCPEVFDKLSIHADGSVVVCCNSYNNEGLLGRVPETSIVELWRHPVIEEYRERLARKEYSGPLCSNCYDYMGLTEGTGTGDDVQTTVDA